MTTTLSSDRTDFWSFARWFGKGWKNQTLTDHGVTYVYFVSDKGSVQIIGGVDSTNNVPFRLRVSQGWVEGRIAGADVSFILSDVKANTAASTAVGKAPTFGSTR